MFDPEPEQIDVAVECKLFEEKTGMSPEAWLAAWQRGEIPDTGWDDSSFIYQRALLLTDDG